MEIANLYRIRFWEKVDRSGGPDACWPWMGGRNDDGYGIAQFDGKFVGAHRLAYMISNGEIPCGFLVCHRCDTPSCVNPSHLWLGTQKDNLADSFAKGRRTIKGTRGPLGRKHMMVDITSLRQIVSDARISLAAISRQSNISRSSIQTIFKGNSSKVHYATFVRLIDALREMGIEPPPTQDTPEN